MIDYLLKKHDNNLFFRHKIIFLDIIQRDAMLWRLYMYEYNHCKYYK